MANLAMGTVTGNGGQGRSRPYKEKKWYRSGLAWIRLPLNVDMELLNSILKVQLGEISIKTDTVRGIRDPLFLVMQARY